MASFDSLLAGTSSSDLSVLAEDLDYLAGGNVVVPGTATTAKGGAGAKALASATAAKSATAGGAVKGAVAGAKGAAGAAGATGGKAAGLHGIGSFLAGKGLSLGLGLELGPWGPVLIGAGAVVAIYGLVKVRQARAAVTDENLLIEALMARYPDFDWKTFLDSDSPLDLRAYLEESGMLPRTAT